MGVSREVVRLGSPANPLQPAPSERASIGQPQDNGFGSPRQAWGHSYAAWTERGRRGQDRATWVDIQRKYNGSLSMIVDMAGSK